MKSLRYNVLAAFAVAQLTFVPASAQDAWHRGGDSLVYVDRDTTKYVRDGNNQNFSRYDKRIHYYRKGWASLIPTQHVLQFCGNMGLVSVGIGWDYGKRRQWETHLLVGFVPKYESDYAKMTFTLKQNFIPWSRYMDHGWTFEPLQCGVYFNTIFGHDFWVKQPVRYAGGYYPFSTRIRPNIFVGQRITKMVPHSRRKYVKSVSFFYELSANDIGIMKFGYNWKAGFWDVFGLSLGFKAQLL